MKIYGKEIKKELIEWIQTIIDRNDNISRRKLSQLICQRMNWVSPNGKYQDVSCRKILLNLNRRGLINLPSCDKEYFIKKGGAKKNKVSLSLPKVECTLKELGKVEIIPIPNRSDRSNNLHAIWNTLMEKYHPLSKGPLCGAQIRYLVKSEKYDFIGGLSFSSGMRKIEARDKFIGWNESARMTHLNKVICNSRFLILPTVKVKYLASHILSKALKRISDDWQVRYTYKPALVETFVDPRRYKGTSYKAANWIYLGKTKARNTPYMNGKIANGKKDIYVYPLIKNWKDILCKEQELPLGTIGKYEFAKDWVDEEFGITEFYDNRLKERLYTIVQDFYNRAGKLIPHACEGSVAKTKAAYRFLGNKEVNMKRLLRAHIEATIQRIKQHKVVLAVSDTTTLSYTKHPPNEGVGPINTTKDKGVGLLLHNTLLFSEEGTPLGVLDVQCWIRNEEEKGKSDLRKKLPIDKKESFKWLKSYNIINQVKMLCKDTTLVNIGDREADIYELFVEAVKNDTKLLIRAQRGKERKTEEGEKLWEQMSRKKIEGYIEIIIPGKGKKPTRKAKLAIRYGKVTLLPPQQKKNLPSVEMWAIYVKEEKQDVEEPIEWILLTTIKTENFDEACQRIKWYSTRWGIEVYHRILKSGCRIEDRLLDTAERLKNCLAIDLVIAWRIYWLTKQGRETPDISCDCILSEEEWKVLCAYVKKEPLPKEPPSLQEAIRMIARLGGFLGRKCDGEPGTTTLWRGLQRLNDLTTGFLLSQSVYSSRASP